MTAYQAPEAIMVLILVLAIITHTLTLSAIRLTDWVFYHGETRQLRFNLRRLLRSAGEEGSIEANLGLALETLCNSLDATYGLIGIIDQGSLHWAAKCHWGIYNHSRSVVLVASMALLVNAVAQLGSSFIDLPRWVHIGLIGALLLGGGLLGLFRRDQLISTRRKFTEDWRSWQP